MLKALLRYTSIFCCILLIFTSCGTKKSSSKSGLYNPKEVAQLSRKLNIPLSNKNKEDDRNMPLYAEVSRWIGTPYSYAGNTKSGVDCSGFTSQVFRKVYNMNLSRSSAGQAKMKQKKISKKNLKAGDLIYFATSKSKKKITHVGVYLKNNKFAHASTSKGVIVSDLDETYYKKRWRFAGRSR